MALHLATRPELPPEEERCGFRIAPGRAPRGFVPRREVRLRVLEAPAGLRVGFFPLDAPEERVELLRLARAVARCRSGPEVHFRPPAPFGVYAGPRSTDRGLRVRPAEDARGRRVHLIEAPGLLLVLSED